MLNVPVMLLGFGAALILSPACKAQESSPDHFTDTGVQDVYQPAPAKPAAAAKAKAKASTTVAQAQMQQVHSTASLQNASTRNSSSVAQPSALAVADKRKVAARKQEKP
jgi:hypothetical protein